MAPIVAGLIKFGLPLLANAVASKGKEWVEEKTGVQLPDLAAGEPPAEVLLQLKQLEFDHQELLINAGLEERKIEAVDRADARSREVAVANAAGMPHIGKITTPVLAIGTVLGFFSVLGGLLYAAAVGVQLADGLREVLYIMLGVLGTQTTQVYNYYFGSSSGSAQKNFERLLEVRK